MGDKLRKHIDKRAFVSFGIKLSCFGGKDQKRKRANVKNTIIVLVHYDNLRFQFAYIDTLQKMFV